MNTLQIIVEEERGVVVAPAAFVDNAWAVLLSKIKIRKANTNTKQTQNKNNKDTDHSSRCNF